MPNNPKKKPIILIEINFKKRNNPGGEATRTKIQVGISREPTQNMTHWN